jgi:tetratricopeptide (TPR) repeat protein
MPQDPLLEEAISAVQQTDYRKAREILTSLVKADPQNPRYWLWLSTSVETSKESIYCLQQCLQYDPENSIARKGMIFFGAQKAEKSRSENLFIRKNDWQTEMLQRFIPPTPEKPAKPKGKPQGVVYVIGAVLIVAAIIASVTFIPRAFRKEAPIITLIQPTGKASATYLPTNTPKGFKPSPTPKLAPALWMLLTETYTPTPYYVDTPHSTEAYQLAMRAFAKGDWETSKKYMYQALDIDPNMPDAYYYLGEISRLSGNKNEALMNYEKAMNLDPKFAAAILAHAKVLKLVKPKSNILDDLNKAIKYDPALFDAYIERARYYLLRNQLDKAMEDLTIARDLYPNSPLIYLNLAQIYMAKDEPGKALENAQKAYDLDITMLDTYLMLGTAYIANNETDKALGYLDTYLEYQPYDADAYEMVGKAYWVAGNTDKALEFYNKSIGLDTNSFDAYYIRGMTSLKTGDPNGALADLSKALEINDNHYQAVYLRAEALLQLKRNMDAYNQFLRSEDLATTDQQRAASIYKQAKSAMAVGSRSNIRDAWKRLLMLPKDVVPDEWRQEADAYLNPCTGKKCETMTATYARTGAAPANPTITPVPLNQ